MTSPGWSLQRQDTATLRQDMPWLEMDAELDLEPLRDPGVVTIGGDWHGETDFAQAVIEQAPAGPAGMRVVLQLGDLSVWPGKAGAAFLDATAAVLERLNGVLLFVDGNHEDHPQLMRYPLRPDGLRVVRPRLYHLPRGMRWVWHGKVWLALGGAHSIDRPLRTEGVDWWPAETMTPHEARAAADGGPADYMVTHDCPAGISMPGIKDPEPGQPKQLFDELTAELVHRQRLLEVVRAVRPRRLLHGHYHVRHDAMLDYGDGTVCHIAGLGKTAALEENATTLDLRTDILSTLGSPGRRATAS